MIFPCVPAEPKHIHLSWEGDPTTSVTVSWRTDSAESSLVEYGTRQSYGWAATGAPGHVHHVGLVNLTPSTLYYYRCGQGDDWSIGMNFTTAPINPNIIYSFAAFGDSKTNGKVLGDICKAVLEEGVGFSVFTGDLVSDGWVQSQWDIWFESAQPLSSRRVLMPCLGNHENDAPLYYIQFALPGTEQWYSFDYGNAHFIALNTECEMTGAQLEWLEQDLASTDAMWKFVFYHRPMYSSGYHGSDLSVRRAWNDLFDKYHVDMTFNGHNHIYERTSPLFGGGVVDSSNDGTIHIVTGGAGAGLHEIQSKKLSWSAVALSDHHYVVITVKEGSLQLQAKLVDGTVFDEIELWKTPLPDLKLEEVIIDPVYPFPGQKSTVTAIVENNGVEESGLFDTRFYIDGETISTNVSNSLKPGERRIIQADWTPTETGSINMTVIVDLDNEVKEGFKEDNNRIDLQILVSEPKPDLAVTEIGCNNLLPTLGDEVIFHAVVVNEGSCSSDGFNLNIRLNGNITSLVGPAGGLGPGEFMLFQTHWVCEWGNLVLCAMVDPEGEIDELYEDNNVNMTIFHFRDLVKDGPAYIPRGIVPGEPAVLYYNQSEGAIPNNSSTCVLFWGIKGWEMPPESIAPPNTVARILFKTKMEKVVDDLWIAVLPTSEDIGWIDLKFADHQLFPEYWDDCGGAGWVIPGRKWAQAWIDGLVEAIEDACLAGVSVSTYWHVVEKSNQSLQAGDYLAVASIVGNTTNQVRKDECLAMLGLATCEYERALKEGLALGRAELFLNVAKAELDQGNYLLSTDFCRQVLDIISEVRSQVGEWIVPAFLILILSLAWIRGHP